MTLASSTTPVPSPPNPGWPPSTPGLRALRAADVMTCPVSAPLIPVPIKRLSGHAKLNDEVSREVPRFDQPRFSRHSRTKASSSLPMIIWASDSNARRVHKLRSSTRPLTTRGMILYKSHHQVVNQMTDGERSFKKKLEFQIALRKIDSAFEACSKQI